MGKVISIKKYKMQHNKMDKEDDLERKRKKEINNLERELDKLLDTYQEKLEKNSKNDSKIHK